MTTGQSALSGPPAAPRIKRQAIRVIVPCDTCAHSGLCAIEEQIEENLVLEVVAIGRPANLALSCSEYKAGDAKRLRNQWSPAQHAKFRATIAAKRRSRAND